MRLVALAAYAFMAGVTALATVGLATAVHRVGLEHAKASMARTVASNCVVTPGAFLNPSELGDFSVITVQNYVRPPFRGSVPGSKPPAFVTNFEAGKLTGFIADIAVTGPDRSAEDAFARSLGYAVGRWPLVPLQGLVVRNNPGLLEAYETLLAFKSKAAAEDWIRSRRQSAVIDPRAQMLALPQEVGDGVAYRTTLGTNDGSHEHLISYTRRFGARVLTLAFQGGAGLRQATVSAYWEAAVHRFARACGLDVMSEMKG